MRLIVCLDDINGMMFFGRRQSCDRVLVAKLLSVTEGHRLFMTEYSKKIFPDCERITVCDDYLEAAGEEDFCFIENGPIDIERASEVIICRWNRRYQADRFFEYDIAAEGFFKSSTEDIAGSSHERITVETYKRQEADTH